MHRETIIPGPGIRVLYQYYPTTNVTEIMLENSIPSYALSTSLTWRTSILHQAKSDLAKESNQRLDVVSSKQCGWHHIGIEECRRKLFISGRNHLYSLLELNPFFSLENTSIFLLHYDGIEVSTPRSKTRLLSWATFFKEDI